MAGLTRRFRKLALALEVAVTYVSVARRRRANDVRGSLHEFRDAPLARRRGRAHLTVASPEQLARATQRVLSLMPTDTRCLNQSLVLSALLARRGIPSKVVVAVDGSPDLFNAHCWVEHAGRPLLPPASDRQSRLVEL